MTLDTKPWRERMVRYLLVHELDDQLEGEDGFDPRSHAQLGKPGQRLLKRLQRHMIARKTKTGKRLYPKVEETGILDEPTRKVLAKEFPFRPSFEDAFLQIARQDDKFDGSQEYTQGPQRWQGVRVVFGKVAVAKKAPELRIGDCSAGYTRWILWALQQSSGEVPHDVVNGQAWQRGYTGTITAVCQKVATPRIGDAIVYFRGSKSVHVTGITSVAERKCVSHGKDRTEIYGWDDHSGRGGFWRPRFMFA